MVINQGDELGINKIITDDLPDAVTLPVIQQATKQDPSCQKLITCITKEHITEDPTLKPYRQVFQKLTYTNGILLWGDKLLIPDAEPSPGAGTLWKHVVDIAHEGHQGTVKCKQVLRSKLWFPDLDKIIQAKVEQCQGCQATTYKPTWDPLKPIVLPVWPWQHIDMDFCGPLPSGEHILVVIDEYSHYPEIEFVSSTGAKAVIPHIDKIFTTHGFPEQVKTDGGPPFNGSKSHEYQQYMKWAGIKAIQVSPDDPEANGLMENFMKVLQKIWHIFKIEGKNPKQEIYKYLWQYRATPHSSTGRPPAELLFGRTCHTRLLEFQEPAHDPQLWHQDAASKAKQKHYKDHKSNVRPHNITTGGLVLLLQKPTKSHSSYDPDPYTVTDMYGTQITATKNGKVRKQD